MQLKIMIINGAIILLRYGPNHFNSLLSDFSSVINSADPIKTARAFQLLISNAHFGVDKASMAVPKGHAASTGESRYLAFFTNVISCHISTGSLIE